MNVWYMGKALKNPWMSWLFSLTKVWYIWSPVCNRKLCYMTFKSILLFSGTKGMFIEQTTPLRTVKHIFRILYLDHENILWLVCSTCLFLLGNNREKAWKCKSFHIPDMILERERSGSRWSITQNKLEINWHGWDEEIICINC